jgi:hypothetical protein
MPLVTSIDVPAGHAKNGVELPRGRACHSD